MRGENEPRRNQCRALRPRGTTPVARIYHARLSRLLHDPYLPAETGCVDWEPTEAFDHAAAERHDDVHVRVGRV